jgi:NAD-dependent SIR2 family protein deacetylase
MGRPVKTESTNYSTLHKRLVKARGPAKNQPCSNCSAVAAEWALVHDKTGQNPNDYVPLCRKCHQKYDDHAGYKRGRPHDEIFGQRTAEQISAQMTSIWAGLTPDQREARTRNAAEARWIRT